MLRKSYTLGLFLCLLLAGCGDAATPVAQGITPLATVNTDSPTTEALDQTATLLPQTVTPVPQTTPSLATSATAKPAATGVPSSASTPASSITQAVVTSAQSPATARSATAPTQPTTLTIPATTSAPHTTGPIKRSTLPPPTAVATASNGLPVTATSAFTMPTPPATPQSPVGVVPQTPLMLPTFGTPPMNDYPGENTLVVRAFLTSLQFEVSGKNSTRYLSTALQTKVAQGTSVMALLNISSIYSSFTVQGQRDTPSVSAILYWSNSTANRAFHLVQENNQWHIDAITPA